ncbi:NUMOD3 domain-containing DNA-binding protein, partial [Streptomyces scabiei]|uniref:NUMOD3 domain-containing DNA-binding protein n=1 Tax=Streptomyces scabiei TaxID=1930 RepID=UPI0038F7E09A
AKKKIGEAVSKAWEDGRCFSWFSNGGLIGEKNPFHGKKHSESSKKQMSDSRASYFANGGVSSTYGKSVPEERKKRIGETYRKRKAL